MDAPENGAAEGLRVAAIRAEIEVIRLRIATTVDALEYKADVPSRLGDVLSATASTFAARVKQRMPSSSRNSSEPAEEPTSETSIRE